MKPARILLLLVAIITGGLAAFLATRGNAPTTERVTVTEIKQEARAQVLVAREAIGVGERLKEKVLEWQDWPEGALRPEYVTIKTTPDAMMELDGAVARFEFFPGEPIREAKLARADQGYLSAVITPGMRAVSINVSAATGAGGFIVPNDQVDVVLTRNTDNGEQSETILLNVKVMAIGTRLGELGKSGKGEDDGSDGDTQAKTFSKETIATLELDPVQAEAIINAAEVGNLTLILRSVVDFAEKIDTPIQSKDTSIQMIRYGKPSSIFTGTEGNAASVQDQPAVAGPASFSVPDGLEDIVTPQQPKQYQVGPSLQREPVE